MKKTLRRFAALVLAVVMTLALGVSAMATSTEKAAIKGPIPSAQDTGTVKIDGFVDDNVTITAYKIVKATYYTSTDAQSGFKGYEVVVDPTLDFVVANGTDANGNPEYKASYPNSDQISLLAKLVSQDATKFPPITGFTLAKQGDTYLATKELPVGEYMVIAEDNDGTTVYNPMLVSVYYTDNAGKVAIDPITVNDFWDGGLATKNAYVKSTTSNPVKEIKDSDIASKDSGNHGNDAAIGDSVSFQISGVTIPSYSVEYFKYADTKTVENSDGTTTTTTTLEEKTAEKAVVFKISDTMDKGLTLKGDIVVKVGNTTLATIKDSDIKTNVTNHSKYTYTYTAASGNNGESFEISLSKDYLKSLAGTGADARAVVITYSATVNENATTNFDPNKNTMTVTYTHKPGTGTEDKDDEDTTEITDTTYHYTFEIDGKIAGKGTGVKYNKTTHELIKINEKGEVVAEEKIFTETSEEYEVPQAVQGAVFKLTGENKTYYAVTDKNGYFVSYDQYKENGGTKTSFGSGASAVASADIKGFKQMDVGSYTLQEVVAPDGYALDNKTHTVVITASYYSEDQADGAKKGQLKSYKIKIDDAQTSTYEATYDKGVVETVGTIEEGTTETTYIKNTRIPTLPSTGSTGTYAFTVIGVAVLGVAAVMVLKGRRKEK